MSSFNLRKLEEDLLEGLDDPPLPPRQKTNTNSAKSSKTTLQSVPPNRGRRLSKARARYESSVRQAVEQTHSSSPSVMIRSHSGWLEKQGGLVKSWKRRWFTFDPFTSTITYWLDETCKQKKGELELESNKIKRDGTFSKIVCFRDHESNSFVINCKSRQLNCRAPTSSEAITWMACLDNEYFFTSLRAEVNARIGYLKKGCIFEKHGRKGLPHDRLVWVTDDEQRICWAKPPSSSSSYIKPKKDAFLYIENIKAIERGRTTAVFKRMAGGNYKNAPEKQCFSILVEGRTLDIIAPDVQTTEGWITALSYLTLFLHAKKERITSTGRWSSTKYTRKNKLPGSSKSSNKNSDTMIKTQNEALQSKQKLEQRGEKLEELNNSSKKLSNTATSFAAHCAALSAQQGRKGWF